MLCTKNTHRASLTQTRLYCLYRLIDLKGERSEEKWRWLRSINVFEPVHASSVARADFIRELKVAVKVALEHRKCGHSCDTPTLCTGMSSLHYSFLIALTVRNDIQDYGELKFWVETNLVWNNLISHSLRADDTTDLRQKLHHNEKLGKLILTQGVKRREKCDNTQ